MFLVINFFLLLPFSNYVEINTHHTFTQFDRLGAMAELEPGDQKAYVF